MRIVVSVAARTGRLGTGDGYRVAGCNRPGGYAGYVIVEVGRLSEEQERRYERELQQSAV
jgi:hypothetical protein